MVEPRRTWSNHAGSCWTPQVLLSAGAQAASAAVPASQLARFKAIEGPFSAADGKWSTVLSKLSAKSPVAQLAKPSLAFVPALKTLDAGLAKIGFSGTAPLTLPPS